ncbi:hypothetical protein ABW636_02845 [Aquimarina sp. 2201CG1-2-11]|uniref:hypothetical protein n=1 Tax=Aquimarina discodermiae TaxID=3231043 RepID=UPI003462BED9
MKILLIVFTLFFSNGNSIQIEEIRDSYKTCNQSEEKATQFFELTEKALHNKGAVYKGYHGAALALKASFAWNPIKKLSNFNKAKKMIDEAIFLEPENVELRMIRLSIQSNAPKIAGYYKNIEEDKKVMLGSVTKITDEGLKEYIENFIAYSNAFSE